MRIKDTLYRWYTQWKTPAHNPGTAPAAALSLAELTIALITTAGVRGREQPPFDTQSGDPTWRRIPGGVDLATLVVDHTHYDTGPAMQDLECVFPLQTLRDLAATGRIGGVCTVHFGLMGYIPDTAPLVQESVPAIVQELLAAKAGAVLLSPG